MESLIVVVLSGVIATLFMAALMYALVWNGFRHGDMIRILGADLTKSPNRYFTMGMVLYLATGVGISWVYFLVLKFFQFDSVIVSTGFSGFMGFSQGFLLMHFYIEELGSRHPIGLYKKYWLPASFAHWFGHMAYGLSIGSMISAYLVFGNRGFYVGSVVILVFAGIIILFAKKNDLKVGLRGAFNKFGSP